MSRGFNKVILMGNLARDPDVRLTPSKQKVARITVAVGRQWKNKATGELQSQTDFIPVVAWTFLADLCERYLRKGRPVLVEGRMQVREYEDTKTGTRKWATEVIAENITLVSSGRREGEGDSFGAIPSPTSRPAVQSEAHQQRQMPQPQYAQPDAGSLRDEIEFEEDFPLDFAGYGGSSNEESDVPF